MKIVKKLFTWIEEQHDINNESLSFIVIWTRFANSFCVLTGEIMLVVRKYQRIWQIMEHRSCIHKCARKRGSRAITGMWRLRSLDILRCDSLRKLGPHGKLVVCYWPADRHLTTQLRCYKTKTTGQSFCYFLKSQDAVNKMSWSEWRSWHSESCIPCTSYV